MAIESYALIKIDGNDICSGASSPDSIGRAAPGSPEFKHKDKVTVVGFTTAAQVPFGPGGASTVQFPPTVITKYVDKTSPLIWQAVAQGTPAEITLELYRPAPSGNEPQNHYTVKFERARLVEAKTYVPLVINEANKFYHTMEDVAFTYQKVTWTYLIGGNVEAVYEQKS